MMSRLIFLMVPAIMLLACAGLKPDLSRFPVRIVHIPVSGRDEATEIIESRVRFLNLTYETALDPEYFTSKLSISCRKKNSVGEPVTQGKSLLVVSRLFLGPGDISGFCPGDSMAREMFEVFIHCKNESSVRRILCPVNSCSHLDWRLLC